MSNAFQHGSRTLFTCPHIRRPEYWQFIKLVVPPGRILPPGKTKWSSDDTNEAFCLRCDTTISYQKTPSVVVRNHMLKKHPQELRDFIAQADAEEKAPAASGGAATTVDADGDATIGSSDTSSTVARPAAKKQRRNQPPATAKPKSRQETAMDLMVRMFCSTLMPLGSVTTGTFINLMKLLSQGSIELPDRPTVCRMVEKMATEYRVETKEKVEDKVTGHYSISAELWYSDVWCRKKFVALLCHHVTEEFQPETFPLGVIYAPNRDDGGANAAKRMEAVITKWGLSKDSLSLLLTSNDTVMCQAATILEAKRFPDLWVVVDTCVDDWIWPPRANRGTSAEVDSMRSIPDARVAVSAVVQDLLKLADGFDSDLEIKKQLSRAKTIAGDEEALLIRQEEGITWDEVYDCLSELMLWKSSIDEFFASSASSSACRIAEPTAKMWFVAEALVLLLRTLREVKQITTKDRARTLPFVIHCLVISKQQLNQENALAPLMDHYRLTMDFDAQEVCADLLMLQKNIVDTLSADYDALVSEFLWCSLLDPRYAKMGHIDEDKREQSKLELTERAVELHQKDAPSQAQGLMYRLLQEEDDEMSNRTDGEKMRNSVADEVAAYLTEHQQRTSRVTDPFAWWRDNRKRYPLLSALARVWLGSVACSSADIGSLRREIPFSVIEDNAEHQDSEDPVKTMIDVLYVNTSIREPRVKKKQQ